MEKILELRYMQTYLHIHAHMLTNTHAHTSRHFMTLLLSIPVLIVGFPVDTYSVSEGSTLFLHVQTNIPVHKGILVLGVLIENGTMQGN